MPVYTKASRARLAARMEVDDEYGDIEDDEQDFTLLWRGPSSMPPPSRSSAPPPSHRASAAPAPRSERPQLPPRTTSAPPPSSSTAPRPEMRAQAAPAHPPPRTLELTVNERRWKIVVRAGVLLSIGCIIGIGTEVLIQRRGADVVPDPSTTSATFPLQGAAASTPASPPPTPTQCMSAMSASAAIAPSPLPTVGTEGATIAHATHHHRHHSQDAAQNATPSPDGGRAPATPAEAVLPDDIAAAAAEALSKAQQETMLP